MELQRTAAKLGPHARPPDASEGGELRVELQALDPAARADGYKWVAELAGAAKESKALFGESLVLSCDGLDCGQLSLKCVKLGGLFGKDACLLKTAFALDMLGDFGPFDQVLRVDDKAQVRVALRLLPAAPAVLAQRLEGGAKLQEDQRHVAAALSARVEALRAAAGGAGQCVFKFKLQVLAVRGLAAAVRAQRGLDLREGCVELQLECPAVGARCCVRLLDCADALAGGPCDVDGSLSAETDVPETVCRGAELARIEFKLRGVAGFALAQGEKLLYHHSRAPFRGSQSVADCVLVTSRRLLEVRGLRVVAEARLSDVLRCTYTGAGLRAGQLSLVLRGAAGSPREEKLHVELSSSSAGEFFARALSRDVSAATRIQAMQHAQPAEEEEERGEAAEKARELLQPPPIVLAGEKAEALRPALLRGVVTLPAGERLEFVLPNGGKEGEVERDCVLLTSARLLRVARGCVDLQVPREELLSARWMPAERLSSEWDELQLTLVTGETQRLRLKHAAAAKWLCGFLKHEASCMAHGDLASRLPSRSLPDELDLRMEATLRAWGHSTGGSFACLVPAAQLGEAQVTFRVLVHPFSANSPREEALSDELDGSHEGSGTIDEVLRFPAAHSVLVAVGAEKLKRVPISREDSTRDLFDQLHADHVDLSDAWQRRWVTLALVPDPLATCESSSGAEAPALLVDFRRVLAPLHAHERPTRGLTVRLPSISVGLCTPQREVMRLTLLKLGARLSAAETQVTGELALGHVQLDNQLEGALFPVILAPTPVVAEARQPCVQLSFHRALMPELPPRVRVFRYASVLLQALDLKLEERAVWQLLGAAAQLYSQQATAHVASFAGPSRHVREQLLWRVAKLVPEAPAEEAFYIFALLQLQPVLVRAWLEADPGSRQSGSSELLFNPLALLMNLGLATLGSLSAAPIQLSGLQLENASGSAHTLRGPLVAHYRWAALSQLYKLLGSLQVLGNPVELVTSLGSGMKDFFYEPARGLVESPQAFGIGLAKGSASLVKGALSGVFSAASAVTGSVGKGVSLLSLNQDFVASRARQQAKPVAHVGDGLLQGGQSFAQGLWGGVSGLVMDPLRGAQQDGLKGLVSGTAKGVLGLVAKPVTGVLDLASATLEGVGNTASYILDEKSLVQPVRPPRVVSVPVRRTPAYEPGDGSQVLERLGRSSLRRSSLDRAEGGGDSVRSDSSGKSVRGSKMMAARTVRMPKDKAAPGSGKFGHAKEAQ